MSNEIPDTLRDSLKDAYFYVVMNSRGEFFRRKGPWRPGDTWVKKLDSARVYLKISQARAAVTFFANQYPELPAPRLVKLDIGLIMIIDETERIAAARVKKKRDQQNRLRREKKWALDRAKKQREEAQQRQDTAIREIDAMADQGQ